MKKKLDCVLLIDDDAATNRFHRIIIERCECTHEIVTVANGQEALDYLTAPGVDAKPKVGLILLDLNMPVMDGWTFLENYKDLREECKSKVVVVMLTSSLNPDDSERALSTGAVDKFHNKPMDADNLMNILRQFFPDHF